LKYNQYLGDVQDLVNHLPLFKEDSNEITNMYPIEKYKMAFFGNGRIVALVRTDNKFRGKSVVIGETKDLVRVLPIYLYRPAVGAPLEIIR
jgi:hypothetical protein